MDRAAPERPGGAAMWQSDEVGTVAGDSPMRWRGAERLVSIILAALALVVLWTAPALADRVQARAGTHADFGRMVFDWPSGVGYDAQISGRRLIVRFDRPVQTDLNTVIARLRDYMTGARISVDGRTVTFQLTGPFSLRDFRSGDRRIVIDLQRTAQSPSPASVTPPASSPSRPETAPRASAPSGPRVPVRSGQHEDYSRLVFDWPRRVDYQVRRDGGRTVLSFSRSGRIDPAPMGGVLPPNVKGFDVGGSGKEVTLAVPAGAQIKHFRSGNKVVVDVYGGSGSGTAAPTQPLAREGKDPSKPLSWPGIPPSPDPGRLPTGTRAATRATSVAALSPEEREAEPASVPTTVPGRASDAPSRSGAQGRVETSSDQPSPNFLAGGRASFGASDIREAASAASDAAREAGALEGLDVGDLPPQTRETRPAPDQPIHVQLVTGEDGATLGFAWPATAIPMAAFTRGDHLWVVFDEAAQFDFTTVQARGEGFITNPEILESKTGGRNTGAALRFLLAAGLKATVERELSTWKIRLAPKAEPLRQEFLPEPQVAPSGRKRVFIQTGPVSQLVTVEDPNFGDTLFVAPVPSEAAGVLEDKEYEGFSLLATAQGVAMTMSRDDLLPKSTEGSGGGIAISPLPSSSGDRSEDFELREKQVSQGVEDELDRLFPLEKWRQGETAEFPFIRQKLDLAIAQAQGAVDQASARGGLQSIESGHELNRKRLDLAHFLFAHGLMPEALGMIDQITDAENGGDPGYLNDRQFIAMRGVARLLTDDVEGAQEDLMIGALDGELEAEMWRGGLQTQRGQAEEAARRFNGTDAFLEAYPPSVRFWLGEQALRAAIAAKASDMAQTFAQVMMPDDPHMAEIDRYTYLQGLFQETFGEMSAAISTYERLMEDSDDLYARSRATLAYVEARLARGPEILAPEETPEERMAKTPEQIEEERQKREEERLAKEKEFRQEAIDRLEQLRFAWRGDGFEAAVLARLAELYIAEDEHRDGLVMLRRTINYFPGTDIARFADERMHEVFKELYLGDDENPPRANELTPLMALALFDEFRELVPVGPDGDEMIRNLADRLVSVDLLNRAAKLLEHQVKFRLAGLDRARVGARLALVRLLDRRPEDAYAAIDASDMEPGAALPPDLDSQRRHLRAQAIFQSALLRSHKIDNKDQAKAVLIRGAEQALELIEDDQSRRANEIRAEIAGKTERWVDAAIAYARLVEEELTQSDKLNVRESRLVLDLAIALSMSGDYNRLDRLRMRFGTKMAGGPHAKAFKLITSTPTGLSEIGSIRQELSEVADFQAFMESYREQIEATRLSAIN